MARHHEMLDIRAPTLLSFSKLNFNTISYSYSGFRTIQQKESPNLLPFLYFPVYTDCTFKVRRQDGKGKRVIVEK
jgi:hypothetical protein